MKLKVSLPKLNFWMVSTIALLLALTFVLFSEVRITGKIVEVALTKEEVAKRCLDYINSNLVQPGTSATLISVEEIDGIYKILTSYQGQEIPVYVTKDGQYLFLSQPLDTSRQILRQRTQQPEQVTISSEELTKFIDCLKNSSFIIYGANWCGWTVRLVEMLGGWDVVRPIYVECTEQQKLCEERGIRGYPTIFIGERQYQGPRTFKDFAEATGCEPPAGSEAVTSSPVGGC